MSAHYDFDKKVDRLNTGSYKWDLLGEDYLPLWVADTDFEVPPAVTARLQRLVDRKHYGYLLTGNGIYDAITAWFDRIYGVSIPGKSWIKLVPGIVPALAVASNLGGVSLTNTPNYSMLLEAPQSAGNKMITVPLRKSMREGFEYYDIDFDALQAAVTPETKLFYLCNPHNPVGRVYSLDELKRVSEFARKNNLIVISDEAHCEIVYEGEHIPFFTVDDYAENNSICLYSNGKLCNLPDLILAFAVIPNAELRERFESLSYAFGEEHVMNVEAGIGAYAESDEWKAELVDYLKANRDFLEAELLRRFPGAKLTHLEGTFLQWVDMRACSTAAVIDAEFFKENAKVFFSDGSDFGGDGYIRINFGTRREILKEALDRMEQAMCPIGHGYKN